MAEISMYYRQFPRVKQILRQHISVFWCATNYTAMRPMLSFVASGVLWLSFISNEVSSKHIGLFALSSSQVSFFKICI